MVSLVFEKTGWLNRYLSYRAATPFVFSENTETYQKITSAKNILMMSYKEVKEKWNILGCPVISES